MLLLILFSTQTFPILKYKKSCKSPAEAARMALLCDPRMKIKKGSIEIL